MLTDNELNELMRLPLRTFGATDEDIDNWAEWGSDGVLNLEESDGQQ